jgi:hypothetical protein
MQKLNWIFRGMHVKLAERLQDKINYNYERNYTSRPQFSILPV